MDCTLRFAGYGIPIYAIHIYGIIYTLNTKRIRPDAFCYHGLSMAIKIYGTIYTINTKHIRMYTIRGSTWHYVAYCHVVTRYTNHVIMDQPTKYHLIS
jgi:hypothetical protein